uniref:hypothetical protein n=1 Tax=Dysosmobacter welbionis TaxID=2093857 RepID=UPI0023F48489
GEAASRLWNRRFSLLYRILSKRKGAESFLRIFRLSAYMQTAARTGPSIVPVRGERAIGAAAL